ncbi:MAG: hypothetical protein E7262_03775 [Lachnospiraceae bacterium]|nr:hypothetical protein [Lachnospiraceae bacterium]
MIINGLNETNTQVGVLKMTQATDSVSKNIQNQIANAQKQLQDLSANKEMTLEEKMKKRQEIQQQITDLNNQLRQHQIEQRKKQQERKNNSMDDMLGGSKKVVHKGGSKGTGISQASMQAIISADSAQETAQVQGRVATKMEGRAGVLESEIKMDAARGVDVTAKKEELAELEQKVTATTFAQMDTLATANKELEEVAKSEQQTEKTDDKDKKIDKKDAVSHKKEDNSVAGKEEVSFSEIKATAEVTKVDVIPSVEVNALEKVAYSHVDISL